MNLNILFFYKFEYASHFSNDNRIHSQQKSTHSNEKYAHVKILDNYENLYNIYFSTLLNSFNLIYENWLKCL